MSTHYSNSNENFNRLHDDAPALASVVPFPAIDIGCDQFLETIFLTARGEVCICTFTPGGNVQRRWEAGSDYGADAHPTYVNISTVQPPANSDTDRLTRRKGDCVETPLIYLDDIGTKISVDRIPCEPTYRLETSPGNCQYGYLLSPPAKPTEAAALLRVLSDKGLTDHGVTGATRLARVPGSLNGKPQHGGWRAKLRTWHPERTWTLGDLTAALGVTPAEFEAALAAERGEQQDALARRGDPNDPPKPGFLALEEAGLILGSAGSGKDLERAWLMRCPGADPGGWDGTAPGHTPGHTDDDTAKVWETGGFKCHHGSCAERNFNDLCEWTAKHPEAGPVLARIKHERPSPFEPVPDTDSGSPADTPPAKPKRARRLLPLGGNAPSTPPRMRPAICSFMARREVTTVAGQPGAGKSAFILSTALAIAANRPDVIGERAFERTGDVLIVSKEDDYDALLRRRSAWLKQHDIDASALQHEPNFIDDPGFTAARDAGSRVELTEDMQWLAAEIAGLRAGGRNVCAVVLDTLTAVMDGLPENDNGTMGRAMALLSGWAESNDVAVLVPHHMAKANGNSGGAGALGSIRGASAIGGGVRLAVTLTEPDDKIKAKLPPNARDRVVILEGAKANHDAKAAPRYFIKETPGVDQLHETGMVVRRAVVALAPFTPNFGWDAESDNAKLAVLTAIANAETPTAEHPEGQPLRVNGHGGNKSATDTIAKQEDAAAGAVARTIDMLSAAGLLVCGPGPKQRNGKTPPVWRVPEKGHAWLAEKRSGVLTSDAETPAETMEAHETSSLTAAKPDVIDFGAVEIDFS